MADASEPRRPDASVSDAALMHRYRQGDTQAFRWLYERHRDPLHRYLLRLAGDASTAEELFQEVWTAVIRGRERYAERESFSAYLFAIAHRRCSDHWRRQYRTPRQHADHADEHDLPDLSLARETTPLPDEIAHDAQLNHALLRAIDQLPLLQREAFLLRAEGGFGVDDIATVTGVSRETAKSRLRYATAKLREMLEHWR